MRWLVLFFFLGWGSGVWAEERFLKLDAEGVGLSFSAVQWECVLDRQTGLVWETKADGGPRARGRTYNWREAGEYAVFLSQWRHCGKGDWRVPEEVELFTLFLSPGVVHGDYFPDTDKASYWSATLGPDGQSPVFVAFYGKGVSYWHPPTQPKRVRLVSGKNLTQE